MDPRRLSSSSSPPETFISPICLRKQRQRQRRIFYGQGNGHVNRGIQRVVAHADHDVDHHHRDQDQKMSSSTSSTSSNTHICSFCGDGCTNIRCSRCKAARYCSGKCQINHWRAGHKFECKEYKSSANVDSASAISSEGVGTSHMGISNSDHHRDPDQMPSTSASSYHCLFCGDDRPDICCARCKVARYCSEFCQTNHWITGHILECKEYKSPADVDSASAVSSEGIGTNHTDISSSDHLRDRDQMPSTSAGPHICLLCGDDRAGTHCTRCKVARYCSQKCQIKHWEAGHKFECKNYKSPSNLDSASTVSEIRGSDHMGRNPYQMPTAPASRDFCFVCGDWSNICCSRCKAIRYCSQVCETKHWREGHKLECKENKSHANVYSASAVSGRSGPGHVGTSRSMYQKSKKDGKLADTVQSPKRTSSKELPSVEECPICFSTILTSEPSYPLLVCHICKNKFHSTCLLKWFSTSKKSRCPLCQSPFSNQKVQP